MKPLFYFQSSETVIFKTDYVDMIWDYQLNIKLLNINFVAARSSAVLFMLIH